MAAPPTYQSERVRGVASDLMQLAADAEAQFGRLAAEQLNWKETAGRWSVAQCFDHLIVTQVHYLPLLRSLAEATSAPTTWERLSPLSGIFGRMLMRSVEPSNRRKIKTSSRSEPASSGIDERIIERFAEHQRELVGHLERLPPLLDPKQVVVTSPLVPFVTYSLDDCLTIFVLHGRRHLGQAERVVKAAGFPL